MSSPPPLSAAAGTGIRQSRSASKAVVKAASGYHVFHIEGYSLAKTIPGGERISSQEFTVGGRSWRVDFYPNGTDKRSKDESDSIALYLAYRGEEDAGDRDVQPLKRLVAEYKFSLLDHADNAAYELPAAKGVFKRSRSRGYDTFIRRDELEGQRARLLLKDDSLAIRCDVAVVDQLRLRSIDIGAKRKRSRRSGRHSDTESSGYSDDTDNESSSYSDDTDTGSSRYSASDDSCFGTDSDDSRSSRHRSKSRRRRQATSSPEDREYLRINES